MKSSLTQRAAALLALACTASASNTWYVDVNGTPPGTGTLADPYTSIQYAVSRPTTLDFDTILVAPGTYVENVRLDAETLYLRSTAGPAVTTIQPSLPGSTVILDAFSELDGFTVRPLLSGGGTLVSVLDGSIRRCILENPVPGSSFGVFVTYSAGIAECTITGMFRGIDMNSFGASVGLVNSIVTGNVEDVRIPGAAVGNIRYCAGIANIDANLYGTGNLTGDVGFWDPAQLDFHPRPDTICIDSGDPSSPPDPDGSRIDIGALTYDPSYAPAPTAYCAGKLNSQGCVPAIGAIGSASATSGAPFVITAANEIPNKVGLLLLGQGRLAQPFQGGLLCVQSPLKRLGVQLAAGSGACTGTYAFDMAAYIASGAHPGLVPGALAHGQWWGRDPLDPAGFGSALSDALAFGIAP